MLTREQLIANRNAELARRAYEGTPGPAGADGAAATITVGTVTTGAAGTDASVTNSGTSSAAVFDFTIPRGNTGATGPGVAAGGTTGQILAKNSNTDYDTKWENPPSVPSPSSSTPLVESGAGAVGTSTDYARGDHVHPATPKAIHKVGITIDGGGSAITTGVKGSVQLDFAGTIIGWSVEADQAGSVSVEIDKCAGTQTSPVVPNTTTDKISASAPIALSFAQAAGADATGVSTWTTAVAQWDTIQFNVASASTVQRATLYVRIQES